MIRSETNDWGSQSLTHQVRVRDQSAQSGSGNEGLIASNHSSTGLKRLNFREALDIFHVQRLSLEEGVGT